MMPDNINKPAPKCIILLPVSPKLLIVNESIKPPIATVKTINIFFHMVNQPLIFTLFCYKNGPITESGADLLYKNRTRLQKKVETIWRKEVTEYWLIILRLHLPYLFHVEEDQNLIALRSNIQLRVLLPLILCTY